MKRITMAIIFVSAALLFNAGMLRAAGGVEVTNVKFTVTGGIITVSYDLQGPAERDYTVKLTLKRKQQPAYSYTPISVSGDAGDGSFAGAGRKIAWDFFKEFPQGLEGDDFYFHVDVAMKPEKKSGGSNTWLYVAGGAVVAGGAAAAILLGGSKDKTSTTTSGYPAPFGRPNGY